MQKILQHRNRNLTGKEQGGLTFSCEQIELFLKPGAPYEGTFLVYGQDGETWGYVTSTDYRMECLNREFGGVQDMVAYRFHAECLEAGEEVTGSIWLFSNLGEYRIPYTVKIQQQEILSSQGVVRNLNQFAMLARSDWAEAVKLFYSSQFTELLKGNERKYLECYRGMRAHAGNQQNVEAFLIACGKKQPVHYRVKEEQIVLNNPAEKCVVSLTVTRDGWGYQRLVAETEGEFLRVEKNVLTEDDFLGNQCALEVYMDPEALHTGKNLGNIILKYGREEIRIPVTVVRGDAAGSYYAVHLERKKRIAELTDCYLQYRMRKLSKEQWLQASADSVERMVAMDDRDIAARLLQAQLLITQEREHEGSWVLTHALELMEEEQNEDPVLRAYYLYLTTLVTPDREYVREVTAQVEELYRQNRTSWKLAWLLLYLSGEYQRDNTARYHFLAKQFAYGCVSPIWYLESLITLSNNPTLLRKLEEYELQVLCFGARNGLLSPELVEQLVYLAGRKREYSGVLLKILIYCYQKKEADTVLQEICAQLIKGARTDHAAFPWYALGVEKELRLTRLYEYYMLSMDLEKEPEISRKAVMYFAWQSNMDYEHTAYLYSYVQKHKGEFEEFYERYKERMEHFVVDQILKKHINRPLAYLYQELLVPAMFSEQLALCLTEILFARRITVTESMITAVLVYRQDVASAYTAPVVNGCAWVPVYQERDVILLEDREGNRYTTEIPHIEERLMDPEPFVELTSSYLLKSRQTGIGWEKYLWDRGRKQNELTSVIAECGKHLLDSEEISGFVKGRVQMRLLNYYQEIGAQTTLEEYLDRIDGEVLDQASRAEVIGCMVERGRMEKAGEWMERYGMEAVLGETLARWCAYMIRTGAAVQEKHLMQAAGQSYAQGSCEPEVLLYLAEHAEISMEEMFLLLQKCREAGVSAVFVCEKILLRGLLYGKRPAMEAELLKEYMTGSASEQLISEVLARWAGGYLRGEWEAESFMIRRIIVRYRDEYPVGSEEKLACLKYFAAVGRPKEEQVVQVRDQFLKEMLGMGIRLNFFRELAGCEEAVRCMADKTILECVAHPAARVQLHYRLDQENEMVEDMMMAPGGIFYKELLLFYGECCEYFFTVYENGQTGNSEIRKVQSDAREVQEGRFAQINRLLKLKEQGDTDRLEQELMTLYHREYLNGRLFTMR